MSDLGPDPPPRPSRFIAGLVDAGCLLVAGLTFVGGVGLLGFLGHEIWNRWPTETSMPHDPVTRAPSHAPTPHEMDGLSSDAEVPPLTPEAGPTFDDSPMPPTQPDPPRSLAVLNAQMDVVYRRKLANPEWIAWNDRSGIPQGIQRFPEELEIQALLSEIARNGVAPTGASVRIIPRLDESVVRMDGVLAPGEWDAALSLEIGTGGTRTVLLLMADERRLLIGCHAFGDTTDAGFDQLRFYFHLDQSRIVRNERIHVGHGTPDVLRETTLEWDGPPAKDENGRWRDYPITDWHVHGHARGAKSMADGHVVYEASLSLVESGIPLDAAFPAFVEVETDPVRAGGKFVRRVHVGELASQQEPAWFRIGAR